MISAIVVSALYVAAQMIADVASLRIVTLAGMSIDAGTFVYPFTFTLRDMVHKVAGIKAARVLIIVAAAVNLVMAGVFWLASVLPPDMEVGPQQEFAIALSPVWRIVFASIVAEVVAELIDTEAYKLWVQRFTARFQWARVLVSNAVSIPIDSALFVLIAFWGVLPAAVVWGVFVSNVVIKGLTTVISIPGIYLVKERES